MPQSSNRALQQELTEHRALQAIERMLIVAILASVLPIPAAERKPSSARAAPKRNNVASKVLICICARLLLCVARSSSLSVSTPHTERPPTRRQRRRLPDIDRATGCEARPLGEGLPQGPGVPRGAHPTRNERAIACMNVCVACEPMCL